MAADMQGEDADMQGEDAVDAGIGGLIDHENCCHGRLTNKSGREPPGARWTASLVLGMSHRGFGCHFLQMPHW